MSAAGLTRQHDTARAWWREAAYQLYIRYPCAAASRTRRIVSADAHRRADESEGELRTRETVDGVTPIWVAMV
jgi:hypothetical protein